MGVDILIRGYPGLSILTSRPYLDPATLLLPSELHPPEVGAPSVFNLGVTSSPKLVLRESRFGVSTLEPFASLNTFPTPSKNPVMFLTRSSLALNHSLKSEPTVLQCSESSEFPSPNSPGADLLFQSPIRPVTKETVEFFGSLYGGPSGCEELRHYIRCSVPVRRQPRYVGFED